MAAGGNLNAEGCKLIFDILQKTGHSLYSLYVEEGSSVTLDVYVPSLKKIISSGKLSREQMNAEMRSYLDKNSEPDERVMTLFDMEMLRLARERTSVHSSVSIAGGFYRFSIPLPNSRREDLQTKIVSS